MHPICSHSHKTSAFVVKSGTKYDIVIGLIKSTPDRVDKAIECIKFGFFNLLKRDADCFTSAECVRFVCFYHHVTRWSKCYACISTHCTLNFKPLKCSPTNKLENTLRTTQSKLLHLFKWINRIALKMQKWIHLRAIHCVNLFTFTENQ